MPKARTRTNVLKLPNFPFGNFLRLLVWDTRPRIKSHRFAINIIATLVILTAGLCVSPAAGIVTFEAESGTLGADWAVSNSSSPAYITITTDNASTTNPSSAARGRQLHRELPGGGHLPALCARAGRPRRIQRRQSVLREQFWEQVTDAQFGLDPGATTWPPPGSRTARRRGDRRRAQLGTGVWKWIDLSQFNGRATPVNFTVTAGNLTQTFQIGARENGLDLDKFVFGSAGTAFTVSNLDNGTVPISNLNTNIFVGPDGIAFHRFSAPANGINSDGANPAAGLAFAGGVLCGTTLNGCAQGAGTAFWMTLDGTNFSTFRTFTNAPDAGNPQGELSFSGSKFFSTSIGGGTSGVGAVFVGQTNGSVSLLKNFSTVSADTATNSGGSSSSALLALSLSGGTLYGTTTAGGPAANGTIFSLTTNGVTFSVLHNFSVLDSNTGTNSDGTLPRSGLILSGGTLYGTASVGGAGGNGVVFSIGTNGGNFTTLYSFTPMDTLTATNTDGAMPLGGLVLSSNTLYGTTCAGGFGGSGTMFSIQTNGSGFAVLHHFTATDPVTATNTDGASPGAALLLSSNVLYGTAAAGGPGAAGTVFALNLANLQFSTIHSFTTVTGNGTNRDGAFPVAPVLQLGNSLYGTTFSGGPGAAGTVFSIPIPAPPAVITNVVRNLNGTMTLSFLGAPNSTNIIQAAASLTPPVAWQNVSTNVADANGAWQFTDNNIPAATRFYRSYVP